MTDLSDLMGGPPVEEKKVPSKQAAKGGVTYWFCVEENHPGSPNLHSDPIHAGRIFEAPRGLEGCPECPACGRQVSAQPCQMTVDGEPMPPQSMFDVAERM